MKTKRNSRVWLCSAQLVVIKITQIFRSPESTGTSCPRPLSSQQSRGKKHFYKCKKILNFHINRFNCTATNNSNSLIPSSPTYRNTARNCPGDINIVSRVGESARQVGVGSTRVGETAQQGWRQVSYQLKTATAAVFIQNRKNKKQYLREYHITSA